MRDRLKRLFDAGQIGSAELDRAVELNLLTASEADDIRAAA